MTPQKLAGLAVVQAAASLDPSPASRLRGAQDALLQWIWDHHGRHPSWLTGGVGIGGPPGGPVGVADRLIVGVQSEVDLLRVPRSFLGVPVETRVVGTIQAQHQAQGSGTKGAGISEMVQHCCCQCGACQGYDRTYRRCTVCKQPFHCSDQGLHWSSRQPPPSEFFRKAGE